MRDLTRALIVATTLTLAGCSSGGAGSEEEPTNPGGGGPGGESPVEFDFLQNEALALQERFETLDITSPSDVPMSGSASYEGVVAYSTAEQDSSAILRDPEMMSQISLEFDFTDSVVEGSLHDFVGDDGAAIDGDLALVGSVTGNQIESAARGTLEVEAGDVSYSGGLTGEFIGDEGAAIFGSISLVGTTEDGSHTVFGTVLAEQ